MSDHRIRRPHVLALVQAGGRGTRMDVLTRETPKPALPFAGAFRLIDFPLSNLRNSGIETVWLSVQYLARAMADVVANGTPWDLDRVRGGFRLVMPEQGAGDLVDDGYVSGNAEDLLRNADEIAAERADALVVLSADHVYRLDYRDVVAQHLDTGAECTVVTTSVGREAARHHVVVRTNRQGVVTGVDHKPERPRSGLVATEVFVYDPVPLIAVLGELHRDLSREPAEDTAASELGDFGERLLPALVARGKVHSYRHRGYWRDLGRPETYLAAHRELLLGEAAGDGGVAEEALFSPDWPIITHHLPRGAARIGSASRIQDSLVSEGCRVEGTVVRSVLGPGVRVGAGARVRDSVLFADAVVEPSARVDWSILDQGVRIGAGAQVGAANPGGEVADELLTLLGRDAVVGAGVRIGRGGRLEPGTMAD